MTWTWIETIFKLNNSYKASNIIARLSQYYTPALRNDGELQAMCIYDDRTPLSLTGPTQGQVQVNKIDDIIIAPYLYFNWLQMIKAFIIYVNI